MSTKVRPASGRARAIKKSVSLPREMLEAAEKAAACDSRNFSNYVQRLISADIESATRKGQEVVS